MVVALAQGSSLDWITQTVDDMKERRIGMDKTMKIVDPFIYSSQNKKPVKIKEKSVDRPTITKIKQIPKRAPLVLQTILNERAKISGKWYKKGSIVQGMRLSKLEANLVILKSNEETKLLLLNKKNRKISLSKHTGQ